MVIAQNYGYPLGWVGVPKKVTISVHSRWPTVVAGSALDDESQAEASDADFMGFQWDFHGEICVFFQGIQWDLVGFHGDIMVELTGRMDTF